MTRINLILFALLILCALGLVTSQHKARKLFVELQRQSEEAKRLDEEWGQLRLEQSTWSMSGRIEKIATGYLQMKVPTSDRIRSVLPSEKADK